MATISLCRAFGLLVETELPVPGALAAGLGADSARPDLLLRWGEAALTGERLQSGPYRLGREGLLFEKAGVARFLCASAGDRVLVENVSGAAPEDIADYLIATALPAVLWMRGQRMLHGGAFVPAGERRAVALLGNSGSGKSTVLRSLVKTGAAVVAEDSLCLRGEAGRLDVSGLPSCLHLRRPGAVLEEDRTIFAVPPAQCRTSAELEAIVVLQPDDDATESTLTRSDTAAALETLLHHRHRPLVPELLGRSADLLPQWAALVASVPVYFWRFPQADLQSAGQGPAWRMLAALNECMEGAL